jgi:hypothetical protein
MHHIKFEKNRSSGYQGLKNVHMLTDTISCLAPPWGQNLYPKDNEIHNFSKGLPSLHHHAFSFSYIHVVSEKKIFFKIGQMWHFLPHPIGPRGAGNLKFTIYVPFVPKIHHTKFEKNWSSGYQEVKNVQMLIDTIYHVCPPLGAKPLPRGL